MFVLMCFNKDINFMTDMKGNCASAWNILIYIFSISKHQLEGPKHIKRIQSEKLAQ
jgi:hypothetical protein